MAPLLSDPLEKPVINQEIAACGAGSLMLCKYVWESVLVLLPHPKQLLSQG